jgi:putative ABC transport system permease protein
MTRSAPFISTVTLLGDLQQVCRQIRNAPGFAGAVILVLALGFGISTAIFSAVRSVLLAPLPYKNPGRLVQIVSKSTNTGELFDGTAPLRDALDWKTTVPGLQDVAMYRYALLNLRTGGRAESLYGAAITSNLLPMLGVRSQLGNWFPAEYDRPGSNHVLMLSDDLWRRQFNADPHIVGKTAQMNNEDYLVIGVMPKGFNFPLKLATTALLPTDQMQYWLPLGRDLAKEPHGAASSRVIARLKDGVALAQVQQQLESACRLQQHDFPETNTNLSASLVPLRQQTVHEVNEPLLALLAAAGMVLLLTCANIASLLLARGESRANELAVRMALGGTAWRVASLPMLHGILLCCCGCLVGVPLAIACLRFLIQLAPVDVPRLADTSIDYRAMLFAAALALICGLLVGGLNALQVLRRSPREVLSHRSRISPGRPRTRLRSSLVAGQVALAIILVSGAGLMLRTFINLLSTDIGYQPSGVLYGVTVLPQSQYPRPEQRELFFKRVLDRLRNAPGVEFASAATGFPLVGQYDEAKVETPGFATADPSASVIVDFNAVSSGYLEGMGVRLVRGRLVAETDNTDMPRVAVIDETLAKTLWPGQDPIGKLINKDDPARPIWRQVVGVVAPMRNRSLDVAARPNVFAPLSQGDGWVNFVVLKSSLTPQAATLILRDAVAEVDSSQGVFFTQTFSELVQDTVAIRHFLFVVLTFFGLAALVLSGLGIYGLVSFIAASRVREVGIRMALGATRANIAALVLSDGIRLTVIGGAVGVSASLLLSRLLSGLLYGVRSSDAETLLFTIVVLGLTTTAAAIIPAWHSARLQPMKALRTE